jgi:DNA-binding CsgD family transcriptional regulator
MNENWYADEIKRRINTFIEKSALSPAEQKHLVLIFAGFSIREAAAVLGLKTDSVNKARKNIYRKLFIPHHGGNRYLIASVLGLRDILMPDVPLPPLVQPVAPVKAQPAVATAKPEGEAA